MSIKENLQAIATVKSLQSNGRSPNAEELEMLSKFNGWGALWQVFKPEHPNNSLLRNHLTKEEFELANASILTAYYTNKDVVKWIWEIVEHLGFKSGKGQKVLEPSCGTGYFIDHVCDWTAVELDPIPAAIAQYLYPNAKVYNQGFEKVSLPDDYFDMAIGNVPFGNYSVFEPRYDGHLIHNHFVSKCIDTVREGGLIALITSTGTLDTLGNHDFRSELADKAKLLTAIRLPSGMMSNANTQVTTDLLVFQKTDELNPIWVETGMCKKFGRIELQLNQIYIKKPENILGEICIDQLYGSDRLAVKADDRNLEEAVKAIYSKLKPCYKDAESKKIMLVPNELLRIPVDGYCFYEGLVYQRTRNQLIRVEDERIGAMLKVLGCLNMLLDAQVSDSDLTETIRGVLNREYDQFVADYGYISSDTNRCFFSSDPRYALLKSLEVEKEKTEIFYKSTTKGYKAPNTCSSPKDALIHCLNTFGKVDIDWIEERYGDQ